MACYCDSSVRYKGRVFSVGLRYGRIMEIKLSGGKPINVTHRDRQRMWAIVMRNSSCRCLGGRISTFNKCKETGRASIVDLCIMS